MASRKRLIASRSIKSFFAATQRESNDKGNGGEKKRKKEDLVDGEVENVDGVVELRKQTEAKTSSYEKKFHSRWLNDFSWLKHDNDKGMLCELCMRCGEKTLSLWDARTTEHPRYREMQKRVTTKTC